VQPARRPAAGLGARDRTWGVGAVHGHLVAELVRRVDGRGIGGFLCEDVCVPLGLDFAIGLGPADQARAVEITGLDDACRVAGAGKPEHYRRVIANPPGARDGAVVNSARWRAAEIPAINGHGTARGIAGFYAALLEGRALAPTLLAEATSVHASGIDQVFGEQNAFGLGFRGRPVTLTELLLPSNSQLTRKN
jgi:CubicO group peptidase (beta-lactamase class C family)